MSFIAELKRRNVFRVGIAYVLMGWVLLQAADFALDLVEAPNWVIQVFVIAVLIGMPIALFFAWAFEVTPEGIKREHEVDRSQSITPQTGQKLNYTIVALLVLAVGYLLLDKLIFSKAGAPPTTGVALTEPAAPSESDAEESIKSVAVLPFTNMSEDASNEFFSDGISEEILNALAGVEDLKVAGRTSSFAFKGRNEDLRMIGETLGVNHILEGSVRKAGNKVRITAQLIQVEDGFHLWSDTYDRELTDIFAIQDEIAGAILEELKAELIGDYSFASQEIDTTAYEKYLLAKQRIYSRNTAELETARELLAEAIELEPGFAPAWAQQGIVSMLLADENYGTMPMEEALVEARTFLDQALELDDSSAEAWAGMGLYYNNEREEQSTLMAIEVLEKALDINPSMLDASNWLQQAYEANQQADKSLQLLEDMFERDPLYRPVTGNLIFLYARTGQLHKARGVLQQVEHFLRDEPHLANDKALINVWAGNFSDALPLARYALERAPDDATNQLALMWTLGSLNEFEAMLNTQTAIPYPRIWALDRLGRSEEALMVARDFAAQDPTLLIEQLTRNGQYEQAVEVVESGWEDLASFDHEFGGTIGWGNPPLLQLALAYRTLDNTEKYQIALDLARANHDRQVAQGAAFSYFWLAEAQYWTLLNDQDKAIDFIELAINSGYVGTPRLSVDYFMLKPLEGHPRYEAAQAKALQNLNRERVEAGFEPLEAAYSL